MMDLFAGPDVEEVYGFVVPLEPAPVADGEESAVRGGHGPPDVFVARGHPGQLLARAAVPQAIALLRGRDRQQLTVGQPACQLHRAVRGVVGGSLLRRDGVPETHRGSAP